MYGLIDRDGKEIDDSIRSVPYIYIDDAPTIPTSPSCSTIITNAENKSLTELLNIYNVQSLINSLALFKYELSFATDATINEDHKSYSSLNEIMPYLTKLEDQVSPYLTYVSDCITELDHSDSNDLQKALAVYNTSKTRYEEMNNGRVSYYEGWLPIYRPLKVSTLFILFGLGLFLILLTTLIFLQMRGIQIKVDIPASTGPSYGPYIYSGAGVAAVITCIGIWRKWW